jgi:hypothetical protein
MHPSLSVALAKANHPLLRGDGDGSPDHVGNEHDFLLQTLHQALFKPRNHLEHLTEYSVLPLFSVEMMLRSRQSKRREPTQ